MRAHESGAYVGILRCERPAKQDEIDLDQLTRLRECFESIKGEALYLGYEDAAGLTRHVEAILNQAVARGAAQLEQEPLGAAHGAVVLPRVDRERYQDVDRQGRLQNRTRWRLVLVNEETEAAHEVSFVLEPAGNDTEGRSAPTILDGADTVAETLAPRARSRLAATLLSGSNEPGSMHRSMD